ncbi:MAG: glycoside hydrolase family 88 protein [Burkholderiales bacterium]|nr:glycoside hydrolase family 88 protein [Burkholderiales bacterium]
MTNRDSTPPPPWHAAALAHAVTQVRRIDAEVSDFPHITEGGRWRTTADGVWTGGFWAGLLWLAAIQARDATLVDAARRMTDRLLPRMHDQHNHDLGFMFYPSAIVAFRQTGNLAYRDAAIAAARALAGQFNPDGNYIPGWGFFGGAEWQGQVLIDTLMNLPLLAWAAGETGDASLLDVAHRHAATSLRYLLRADGSVYHMFRFDPASGAPLGGDTYQGAGPESAWARGQAWALTGLAILGAMTGDATYAAASARVARTFVDALPPERIPPWDFHDRQPDAARDASAAAIAAYGLLRLARLTGNPAHRDDAVDLLAALWQRCANRGEEGGLLLHATADLPHGLGIDESTMYGDYYYVKALTALAE